VIGARPYGTLRYLRINGRRMAYVDEGEGDAIVFQHGQPTSSYVWRNVMPHLEGYGRLVACDLIGMGASEKLPPELGPDRYSLRAHREYLFALWEALELGNRVILVLDDWGAALGFHWADRNRERVQGIVHMEAVAAPMSWTDLAENARPIFRQLRSPAGEALVLEQNLFIEKILPNAVLRRFTAEELEHYRRPFEQPGEDRRPTLSWPRSLPLDGEPAEVVDVIRSSCLWLSRSDIPKLFINGEPGQLVGAHLRGIIRGWPNQAEVAVKGRKLLQEDSPEEIGEAIAVFVGRLRRAQPPQRNLEFRL
jgi:haloalkane dehalogenase